MDDELLDDAVLLVFVAVAFFELFDLLQYPVLVLLAVSFLDAVRVHLEVRPDVVANQVDEVLALRL